MKTIHVGSRPSRLALAQVKEIFSLLREGGAVVDYRLRTFDTAGDKDKKTSLTVNPADDFFTDTLDRALLSRHIDIAIHSAKDLPRVLGKGLSVFALTGPLDDTDAFVGPVSIFKLKKGARVGTSSVLRKREIESLNPGIKTVDIRGTIDERLALADQGKVDGVIVASCALQRLGLGHLIKDVLPYETTPLQGQLAVVGREGDVELGKIFSRIDVRKKFGKVILVGAGPGDPELITLKGIKALERADAVFYDYLVDPQLLRYAQKAEKIFAGKRKGQRALPQPKLSRMLLNKAREGKNAVRLKGGDPLIFGRGADEIDYLHSYHVETEIIPGVSSATGLASALGIPLTARGISSSVAFVSGHSENETALRPQPVAVPKVDTVVFLMGLTKLGAIVRSLKKSGWKKETPVIVIANGTRKNEQIVSGTVQTIERLVQKEQPKQPALIIVGEVVRFWRKRPPPQKAILYVGTNPEKYRALGPIVHLPVIEITPVPLSREETKKMAEDLKNYDIMVLTSRFAVSCVMGILEKGNCPPSKLAFLDIAVIGEDTARELRKYQLEPEVTASQETSEGLLAAMKEKLQLKGKRIFFPRSALPNPFLKNELIKCGAKVNEVAVYDNAKPARKPVSLEGIRQVIFTSPSTVNNFLADYGPIPKDWLIISKGPHTQKALQKAGYQSEVLDNDKIS